MRCAVLVHPQLEPCEGEEVLYFSFARTESVVPLCREHRAAARAEEGATQTYAALIDRAADKFVRREVSQRVRRIDRWRAAGQRSTYIAQRAGWVKIGRSHNVPRRMEQLMNAGTAIPVGMDLADPVTLLVTFPSDVEAMLHDIFDRHRIAGTEWFLLEGELASWIERFSARVVTGTDDIARLVRYPPGPHPPRSQS